jgi:uncharacterized metal-binding protein (TIGR02443 family)
MTKTQATHNSIKKVKAKVIEVYVEPDFVYSANCPYCQTTRTDQVFDENYTIKVKCVKCQRDYKVKIPKFY